MSGKDNQPAITEDEIRRLVSVVVDEAMAVKGDNPPKDAASIAIGADHGGFPLKERLGFRLKESGYDVLETFVTAPYDDETLEVTHVGLEGLVRIGDLRGLHA